jgi:hypothetical protein
MSLLDEYIKDTGKCVLLDRKTEPDGRGGIIYTYTEGAEFDAAIYLENSLEEQIAEKQGVSGIYQVTVSRTVRLEYHTIFKRLSDGKTFRVTSKDEKKSPASSSLDMRVVRAEEYDLPADGE